MKQKRKRRTLADKAREATEQKLKDTILTFLDKQKALLGDNRDRIMMEAAITAVTVMDTHELSQQVHAAIQASFLDRYGIPQAKEVFPPHLLGGGGIMNASEESTLGTVRGDNIT